MQNVMCIAFVFLAFVATTSQTVASNVHTVFTTECGTYFDWQALGMVFSHRKAGQPGRITRLMSCTDEQWASYTHKDLVPTHRAPSFTRNPHNNDLYSAYNKPEAVIDWLAHNEVEEDFVLILDADMIMRAPFLPEDMGAAQGTAISAYYGYLKGVNNELALKHVPEVPPRNDTLAGPYGRRGDQVGGFILMHRDDLKRMAPLWLKYAEDVRFDPDAWNLTGDVYSKKPGDKPWISEMYGYSFGAAKADVWHRYHTTAMIYPGYQPIEPPKVLHYGLLWDMEVDGQKYSFDKHWHYQFHAMRCPPWDLEGHRTDAKGGLFPHPPRASAFNSSGLTLLKDLLSIEVPLTLNEAFCEHHRKHCPPSEELDRECGRVEADAAELQQAFAHLQLPVSLCEDAEAQCAEWAEAGECGRNVAFMVAKCRRSCGLCGKVGKAPKLTGRQDSQDGSRGGGAPPPDAVAERGGNATQSTVEPARQPSSDEKIDLVALASAQAAPGNKPDQPGQVVGGTKPGQAGGDGGRRSPADKVEAAPRDVPRTKALQKLARPKVLDSQSNPDRVMVERLTAACTSNSRLSMAQVKECLKRAKDGQSYQAAPEHSTIGSSQATHAQQEADALALEAVRQQLDAGDIEAGSYTVSRRLRQRRSVRAPGTTAAPGNSFVTKLGAIGLALWCITVVLFLCLLPRNRPARQRFSPYRARKASIF